MNKHDVVQIIPADGWYARYRDEEGGEFHVRLIAWALLRSGKVVGVDTDMAGVMQVLCDEVSNLIGYGHVDWHVRDLRGHERRVA